jgi:hypothetical protein
MTDKEKIAALKEIADRYVTSFYLREIERTPTSWGDQFIELSNQLKQEREKIEKVINE